MRHDKHLDHFVSTQDVYYGEQQVHQECQTEIQNATTRNLQLQIIHDRPFNFQSQKVPVLDQTSQTEVTSTIIDFIAGGAQKFEQLHMFGLIQGIDTK